MKPAGSRPVSPVPPNAMNACRILLCLGLVSFAPAAPIVPPEDAEPIAITQTEPAAFPPDLAAQGFTRGWARVLVAVDEQGRLVDTLVIGHSHPRFAEAAVGALAKWQFHPAQGRDGPILSVTPLNFVFRNDGPGASVTAVPAAEGGETVAPPPLPAAISLLVRFSDLDRLPTPVHLVAPAYSDEDARRNAGKKVVVQFYIDETGKVRMPTLTYADDLAVARRALAAVAEWRFLPPKFQDRPVVTRVSQTFKF